MLFQTCSDIGFANYYFALLSHLVVCISEHIIMQIKSIKSFNNQIKKLSHAHQSSKILFRGQINKSWKLETSLERTGHKNMKCVEYYMWIDKMKPLINPYISEKWKRRTTRSGYPFNFKEYDEGSWDLPEIEYIAYLRHHGFPTPILDWSQSPFVALFFACEDFISTKTGGKVFVYIDKENYVVDGDNIPSMRRIGHYVEAGRRHLAQKSEYLLPSKYFNSEWHFVPVDEVLKYDPNRYLIEEIEIDKKSKKVIISELHNMLINRHNIYFDEDSLIKHFADEFAIQTIK